MPRLSASAQLPLLRRDDALCLPHTDERIQRVVQVRVAMRRGDLRADARGAERDDWVAEANHVDTCGEHFVGELDGEARVAEHHRDDRVRFGAGHGEARRAERRAEAGGLALQLCDRCDALLEHLEHLERRTHHGGRHRVGEEVRPRLLPEHADDLLAAGGVPSRRAAKRLAERRVDHIDRRFYAKVLRGPLACRAEEACRVALVYKHLRVVLASERADLVEWRDVAVHREGAVGRDEARARALRGDELLLQVRHVEVLVPEAFGLAQPDAVDDRRVVERIGEHGVLLRQDGLEETCVGVETGGEEDGVLCAVEGGDGVLELLVDVLRAADEAHARHAQPVRRERLLRDLDEPRVVGEAEVVVGAEVEHRLRRVGHLHARLHRTRDDSLPLERPACLHLL
mmetsp:Transcript_49423/g.122833  ORF Transcript_49423/g.122833 Transcript_49423/m.122833 type:complete len:400 (+) Transcript_49423:187-1386(+)